MMKYIAILFLILLSTSAFAGQRTDALGIFNSTGAVIAGGTLFTISGCSATTPVGGATAGIYKSGTTGTCTVTITMNGAVGLQAPNGWACFAYDITTQSDLIGQTASTTATATLSGTTVSGDIISFNCVGY